MLEEHVNLDSEVVKASAEAKASGRLTPPHQSRAMVQDTSQEAVRGERGNGGPVLATTANANDRRRRRKVQKKKRK